MDADPSRLAALLIGCVGLLCALFAPCQPGASTPKTGNLFLRGPKAAGSGHVVRGTLDEIRTLFGVENSWRLANLEKHFQRVVNSVYHRVELACTCCTGTRVQWQTLDVIRGVRYCSSNRSFVVELGTDFRTTAKNSFSFPLAAVSALVQGEHLQALDRLLWYSWQLSRKDRSRINPFAPNGPFGLAPITVSPKKQRSRLQDAHDRVVAVWPACPFRIVGEGETTAIIYAPDHPNGRAARKTGNVTIRRRPAPRLMRSVMASIQTTLKNVQKNLDAVRNHSKASSTPRPRRPQSNNPPMTTREPADRTPQHDQADSRGPPR